ncbi:uncharacterized protein H6S33_001082 [Morchella sextelata]|uniref:uncharacterized protein n=1 Tax=Morchella sextelata TaxID=1174677 RepID=UPI001D04DC23|nr:uncharacterized protein H6S33_001082 [Morchella sextelata]KAH0608854.1 hypothetical protein H6S33_001082 [Morchella sextelata]
MLRNIALLAALFASTLSAHPLEAVKEKRGDDDWVSPVYTRIFQDPLVIPTQLQPMTTYTNATTGEVFDFYQMTIDNFQKQVYPGLQPADLQGYNGQVPGPLIKTTVGRRSVVRFINNVAKPASIHLHGSPSRPVFDGWAEDTIATGQYKDYVYPNYSPRTLWYHDHAVHITAENVFHGQAGFYYVSDPAQEAALALPQGAYDIPLLIVDKIYLSNGKTLSPATEDTSYYGDVIHVNGVPWPYLNVEPRKYRFRLLDGSTSRSYKMSIETSAGVKVPMKVIATDAGYVENPVNTNTLIFAIAERYEIVVDFAAYAGQTLVMKNARDFSRNEDFAQTNKIMQFRVGTTVSSTAGNGAVPSTLVDLTFPTNTGTIDRHFKFERTNGEWRINGLGFADVANRILAKPNAGAVEVWELENSSGGWAHPIHIHLIDFKVLTRNGRGVEPYESAGFKDVVFLDENETVTVIARYHPWTGQYMFHCHNTVHEDQDMMAAFDVGDTKAVPAQGDQFSDPMNPTFRASAYTGTNVAQLMSERLPYFAGLDIYSQMPV